MRASRGGDTDLDRVCLATCGDWSRLMKGERPLPTFTAPLFPPPPERRKGEAFCICETRGCLEVSKEGEKADARRVWYIHKWKFTMSIPSSKHLLTLLM